MQELLFFNDQMINDIQEGFDGKTEIENQDLITPSEKHFNHIFHIYDKHNQKINNLQVLEYYLNEKDPNNIHVAPKKGNNYLLFNPSIIIDYFCHHLNNLSTEKIKKL